MLPLAVYSGPASSADIVREELARFFRIETPDAVPEEVLPAFSQCTVFLDASMKVPLGPEAIGAARHLKLIATATTGADHIDAASLEARDIPLLTLKGQREILWNLTAAAEHSWLLLMSCARTLRGAIHHVDAGDWERTNFPGTMLKGKTLGLIGFGRIGHWMARYAAGFGMNVQAFDPFVDAFADGVRGVDLETVLTESDFISIHVNLTPETRGMLTADRIRRIRKGAIFINTSRGDLVDEKALVEGLREGCIAGVGVDVLTGEPDVRANPLWVYAQTHDNVIVTPHIGGFCPEAVDQVVRFSCRRILDHLGLK